MEEKAEPSPGTVEKKAEPSPATVEEKADPSPGTVDDEAGPSPATVEDEAGPSPEAEKAGPSPEAVVEKAAAVSRNGAPVPASSSSVAFAKAARHQRSGSFQRWTRQMQKALRWGATSSKEQGIRTSLNLEVMANQKRQWYQNQIRSHSQDHKQHEPSSLFEHFFVVGLHSHSNVEVIEDAFAKKKTWEAEVAKSDIVNLHKVQSYARTPTLDPQILFKYPPGKKLSMRERDLPAFCFPGGVKARLIQRTPSMSDLNELVYGQEHLARDDSSFIFCLKDSDNATVYGVCLHVQEIVQRTPVILGAISPPTRSSRMSRFLVSAPRCYCILTRVPFFELHFEMLNSILAQERLDRITQFASEMALSENVLRGASARDSMDGNSESPVTERVTNWMDSVIPVDSVFSFTQSTTPDTCRSLPSRSPEHEPESPESTSNSEFSEISQTKDLEKEMRKSSQFDDVSECSETHSDSFEKANGGHENGHMSPMSFSCSGRRLERIGSLESIYSSARSMGSDVDDDELFIKHDKEVCNEKVMEWAKEHSNEPLQIVCGYHTLRLPSRGNDIIFHPLEHLQPISYLRPGIASLGLGGTYSSVDLSYPSEVDEVNARLTAAEESHALSLWTTSTVCRVLSLESILTLLTGALLEKQVVIVCQNLGILSATVLSLVPMLRPFEWQSLFLPVLPKKMLDFLDAPVPFIVGIHQKPSNLKLKTANLVRVNLHKNQVKACQLPLLPRHKELMMELTPIHARLSSEGYIAKRHPVYKCSEIQAEAANQFLTILRNYLESLCSNLRSHTITSVQSNNDRVSLLLKESFIDSFPARDRHFIKLFVETQLFSVLSDSRLSTYENDHS